MAWLLTQDGEQVFWFLASNLQVQGVRAQVDLITPGKFAGCA